jgi:hypothetical protein
MLPTEPLAPPDVSPDAVVADRSDATSSLAGVVAEPDLSPELRAFVARIARFGR